MKRLISLAIAAMIAGQAWAQANFDFSATSNGKTLYYKKTSDTEVLVTSPQKSTSNYDYNYSGYTKPSGDLVIPETVVSNSVTYTVAGIDEYAFVKCSGLTSVVIPNSVKSINVYSFYGCSGLKSITIPESVTSIDSYAFIGCNNIETLSFNTNAI